jgi:hypothetical protein
MTDEDLDKAVEAARDAWDHAFALTNEQIRRRDG